MSTYCISDIHGNLSALQALLKKIRFHDDGSDQLYLLGDYVDWGPCSIETLQFVMELSKKPFVTCLIGNHDQMFLDEILQSDCGLNNRGFDTNWLYNNRGIYTWDAYMKLPMEEREAIRDWFLNCPYSARVCVNEQWYLLGHAGPYLPEEGISLMEQRMKQMNAVWHRMESPTDNPLDGLERQFSKSIWEPRPYQRFICGHSITHHYQKVPKGSHYRIFKGPYFIDLDCGAKCMGLDPTNEPAAAQAIYQGCLAAYCIDSDKNYYCDRRHAGYEQPVQEEE